MRNELGRLDDRRSWSQPECDGVRPGAAGRVDRRGPRGPGMAGSRGRRDRGLRSAPLTARCRLGVRSGCSSFAALAGRTGVDGGLLSAERLGSILVEIGRVQVARSRARGGDLVQGVDQAVDVVRRGAEPDAGPDGSREGGTPSRSQLGGEAVDLAVGYAEQPRDEWVRAEAAVANARSRARRSGWRPAADGGSRRG